MKKSVVVSIVSVVLTFAAVAEDLVYTVEAGQTETVTEAINADVANVSRLIKRGAGTLQLQGNVGATRNFAEMEVEAGSVELSMGADCFKPTNVVIRGGASVLNTGAKAVFMNTASFDIKAGGFLSLGGIADTIDGFRGDGIVSNKTAVSVTLNLAKGPYRFGGRVVGDSIFECAASSGAANAHKVFVVCASDALADTRWRMGSGTVTNLVFASGLTEAHIGQLQAGGNGRPVYTNNEDGDPVAVYWNAYGYGGDWLQVRGSGDFVHCGANLTDHALAKPDSFSGFTGRLVCGAGSLCIGANNTPGSQPDVSALAEVVNVPLGSKVATRMQFRNQNCQTNVFNCTVRGSEANSMASTFDFIGPTVVRRFETQGVLVNHYTNLVMKGGHLAVNSNGFQHKNAGCSFVIEGGLFSSYRLPHSNTSVYNRDWSKLLYPMAIAVSAPQHGHFYLCGGEAVLKEKVPDCDIDAGGVFSIDGGKIAPNDSATAGKPTRLYFNGGTMRIKNVQSPFGMEAVSASSKLKVLVGPLGMKLENEGETGLWTDTMCYSWFDQPFESGAEDGVDGGIARIGAGHFQFWKPLAITGPFRALDGTIDLVEKPGITGATVPLFGTGDFVIGNSALRYGGSVTTAFAARIGTDGRFVTTGAATLRLKTSSSQPVDLLLGSFARERGGALFLYSDVDQVNQFSASASGKVGFVGGLEKYESGLVKAPLFTMVHPSGMDAGKMSFATYDDANGCVEAFTGMAEGVVEGTVANVETTAVTVPEDATVNVEALRVSGVKDVNVAAVGVAPLVISSGATVKVGNGTDPACVILTSPYDAQRAAIKGAGTLDFGTSEGVIAVNRSHTAVLGVKVSGSNGVTFVGPVDGSYETLSITAANDYTGGTIINGMTVLVGNAGAFGSGKVVCGGGKIGGGRLRFDTAGIVLPNDLRLSGYGATRGDQGQWGALYFPRSATVSGAVELVGKTRIVASGSSSVGTLSGVVSGDRLQVWDPALCENGSKVGDIVLSAVNTYTGGTEVVRSKLTLRGAGTLGTGDVLLDGGTIVFEDDTAANFANRVDGVGTLAVKNRKTVANFTNLDSEYDGLALGLADKRCTVGSLNGFSSVTNMTAVAADLYVLDGSASSFAGKVSANVTLHDGARVPPGMMIIVR